MDLKALLDPSSLRRLAGARSYVRGVEYFHDGRVHGLVELDGTVAARVRGSRDYKVRLCSERSRILHACNCPVGEDGEFCKHGVAVGLAYLDPATHDHPGAERTAQSEVTMNEVRAYLAGLPQEELVGMLMTRALEDELLRRKLLLLTARKRPQGPDLGTFRQAITSALDVPDFIEYDEMDGYVDEVLRVVDSVEDLLKEGRAADVIGLTEHALTQTELAMESVDDSSGRMSEVFERLQALHLQACRKAKPDPEELARRLFGWELGGGWDSFRGAAETYARVLGESGLAAYRALAAAEWAKVPPLTPGKSDAEKYGKRFRITHIMETLARRSGDVEAVVAVMQRDLSSSFEYFQIVEAYRKARKQALALEWAERGLKAFPAETDEQLREFLAKEYHRQGRHDEAMALIWAEFTEQISPEQYRRLKVHADRIGAWPAWREKALAHVRARIETKRSRPSRNAWDQAGHSDLVSLFLWEGDDEAAWREARAGGCRKDLWLALAAKREKLHPADAVEALKLLIEPTLEVRNKEAYRTATGFLRRIGKLMTRLGQDEEFRHLLASIRASHKAKRNFMKLLDEAYG